MGRCKREILRSGWGLAAALLLASVTHNVSAATPPQAAQGAVPILIPQIGETTFVNLRELRALSGSPPVSVIRPEILFNGRPAGLVVTVIETIPGAVCLQIENGNFIPPVEGPADYSLFFGASNPNFPETVFLTTQIENQQGPTTNPQSPTCADPNSPPVANPSRTATQFAEGESIVLDGSASTDVDEGTILTYIWDGPGIEFLQTEESRVTLNSLAAGTYTFGLRVRDDSLVDNDESARVPFTITVVPAALPTANAGPDQTVNDANADGFETVTLSAVQDGSVQTFQWFIGEEELIGEQQTFDYDFAIGTTTVTLRVFDEAGRSAFDEVVVVVREAQPPTANAGEAQSLADTDGAPGENVILQGSGADPEGGALTYQWIANDQVLGTQARLETRLNDGTTEVELIVTDESGLTATDVVTITIANANVPTANAGTDRRVADTDGQAGENVTLDASASVATGGIASYEWRNAQNELVATGVTPTVRLSDGSNVISLLVLGNGGTSASDTVTITVDAAPQLPIANAGADQIVADSDREEGEAVTLTGLGTDPNGQPLSYQWSLGSEPVVVLGNEATITVRLRDGENLVSLRVQDPDGNAAVDTVLITVSAPAQRISLAELPNLTANKRSVALALDRACVDLDQLSRGETQLTDDQRAMLERCNGLYFNNTAENQSNALGALSGDDFAAARTQTLLFSNTLYASVMDRLVALRGGARGLSLAGLNIVIDGQPIPLAQLQDMAKSLLGGGASSDADRAGGLFSDKLGVWVRGNYSMGEKEDSPSSPRFEADQWALIGGLDYRLSEQAVIGASVAYGQSGIEFRPSSEGALDTNSWAVSTYGSLYAAKNFYFDAILNVAQSDYAAERNITYVDGAGLINADARGTTDGMTLSGGVSAGYDFLWGRFTFSPTFGAFYIDAAIDGFTESGAQGLNLIYDEQKFTSLTGNLGVRMTYAVNAMWGVLLPHVRVDYVREFEDDVDVFGVRFAADPNAASTPPILVQTDNPDRSYWRLATGFSAQFAHGISGYVEYQRLESFQFISFQDLSVGLRLQKNF